MDKFHNSYTRICR